METSNPQTFHPALKREIAAGEYEIMDDGSLFLPISRVIAGGKFTHELMRLTPAAVALRLDNPMLDRIIHRPRLARAVLPRDLRARLNERFMVGEPQTDHNLVANQGLDHILTAVFTGTALANLAPWYLGIFENASYTPAASDTAANITSNSTETTSYDESTRVAYVEGAPASQSITNGPSNKATFTMNNVSSKNIQGAFLVSSAGSAKSSTAGTLMSSSKFGAARTVIDNDQLLLTYVFTVADA